MAQPARLRPTWSGRWLREAEQFNGVLTVESQISLPGIAFFTVLLAQQPEPENVAVEMFAGLIISADDSNVVDLAKVKHSHIL